MPTVNDFVPFAVSPSTRSGQACQTMHGSAFDTAVLSTPAASFERLRLNGWMYSPFSITYARLNKCRYLVTASAARQSAPGVTGGEPPSVSRAIGLLRPTPSASQ